MEKKREAKMLVMEEDRLRFRMFWTTCEECGIMFLLKKMDDLFTLIFCPANLHKDLSIF